MAHSYIHAKSSAKRFGGSPEDYLEIHTWFDATKEYEATFRHRALRHHTHGIFEAEHVFGPMLKLSNGREVPTRVVSEQHVKEDFSGFIPSPDLWLRSIPKADWMTDVGDQSRVIAEMSVKEFGGSPEDYLKIHAWFEETHATIPGYQHKALRYHAHGALEAKRRFGDTMVNSDDVHVPVRDVALLHIKADTGFVPTLHDWVKGIRNERWMNPTPAYQSRLERFVEDVEDPVLPAP